MNGIRAEREDRERERKVQPAKAEEAKEWIVRQLDERPESDECPVAILRESECAVLYELHDRRNAMPITIPADEADDRVV